VETLGREWESGKLSIGGKKLTYHRRVPLVKQELLTLPGHLSSISVLVGFVMLNHKRIMFKWIIVFVLFLSAIVLSEIELRCPGRVSSSCFTSGTRRVTVILRYVN
jgi:Na+-translocating ferredoxin:NAD+ oxidoreductase RnfD subunit